MNQSKTMIPRGAVYEQSVSRWSPCNSVGVIKPVGSNRPFNHRLMQKGVNEALTSSRQEEEQWEY